MRHRMATIVIAAIFVSGCSLFLSKETRYLGEAENRATQQEVQRELGRPTTTATTPQGDTVWVYEVRTIEPGAQSTWSTSGSWCDEYRLTFDAQGVLRGWTHKAYLHGGELMPISCNGLIGVQKPAL